MAIERLKKIYEELSTLVQTTSPTPEFNSWYRYTVVSIAQIFGESSIHVDQFKEALEEFFGNQSAHSRMSELTLQEFQGRNHDRIVSVETPYTRALKSGALLLESFMQEIERHGEDDSRFIGSSNDSKGEDMNTKKVFVVHGRDEGTKHTVARFLQNCNLEAVILDEQPDEGLTVIEKFERHARSVEFAVVLLTPDDVGALQGEEENLKPRARQNVILELGYFMGCLGRKKVCSLIKGDIEKPSDYHGVIYIQMDEHGGWKEQLLRNLGAADSDVNAD